MHRRTLLFSAPLFLALSAPRALAAPEPLKFRELYARGRDLSEKTQALEGRQVEMIGYMAPPLKPEINFFVLTKLPMSTCPFCETEAQWPDDIVLAIADAPVSVVRYTDLIRVTGILETGFSIDAETGFVSFIRLRHVHYEKL